MPLNLCYFLDAAFIIKTRIRIKMVVSVDLECIGLLWSRVGPHKYLKKCVLTHTRACKIQH